MGIDKKFILVGHSFGGYVAATYSMKYPDNLCKLVLLSPAGFSKFEKTSNLDVIMKNSNNSYIKKKIAQSAEWIWDKNVSAFDLFRKLGIPITA